MHEPSVLAPESSQLLALVAGQAVVALVAIDLVVATPVAQRLLDTPSASASSRGDLSCFSSTLKERFVWRHEFETLEQGREVIGAYIDRYHHRPHQGLNYRAPAEVDQTWDDALGDLQTQAA